MWALGLQQQHGLFSQDAAATWGLWLVAACSAAWMGATTADGGAADVCAGHELQPNTAPLSGLLQMFMAACTLAALRW